MTFNILTGDTDILSYFIKTFLFNQIARLTSI